MLRVVLWWSFVQPKPDNYIEKKIFKAPKQIKMPTLDTGRQIIANCYHNQGVHVGEIMSFLYLYSFLFINLTFLCYYLFDFKHCHACSLPAFSKLCSHQSQNSRHVVYNGLLSVKQKFYLDMFNLNPIASKTLICNNWLIKIDLKDNFSE